MKYQHVVLACVEGLIFKNSGYINFELFEHKFTLNQTKSIVEKNLPGEPICNSQDYSHLQCEQLLELDFDLIGHPTETLNKM